MKKVIPLGFLAVAAMIGTVLYLDNPWRDNPSLKLQSQKPLDETTVGVYQVKLRAIQAPKNQSPNVISSIEGTFIQYEEAPGQLLSQWQNIQELSINGRQATEAEKNELIGKVTLSKKTGKSSFAHYFAKDYPSAWYRLNLNLLQRISLSERDPNSSVYQRRESEEMGDHLIEYTNLDRGSYRDIKKQYLSYDNSQIVLDRAKNSFHFTTTQKGRIISAEGEQAFVHEAVGDEPFLVSLGIELKDVLPKPKQSELSLNDLELADAAKLRLVATENRTHDTISFEEAMNLLPRITKSTDGRDIYMIFAAIKAEVQNHPASSELVAKAILALEGRDEGSKRALALAFGALAQSDVEASSLVLSSLISECKDLFCKDQAIVALNDHAKPTLVSTETLVKIVKENANYDITAAAILALGSIGHKAKNFQKLVVDALIDSYRKSSYEALKRTVIAGMGNHGDDAYTAAIHEGMKDKDSALRGASFYSLRHLQANETNEILTSALESEQDASVVNEGLKAMAYRQLTQVQYVRVAKRVAKLNNEEDAKEATRLFVKSYEKHPELVGQAMKVLREQSPVAKVKSVIARSLETKTSF